ncbi:unnamed protein product [Prunus armeniaca]|uniref:Uncharacterized protein n=1 Tax=Prunus armeniaca TaxID=36596 RepID=A0A6J5Y9J8_PRUAR|nr:unnamed protein product [Prunus armeniaca]
MCQENILSRMEQLKQNGASSPTILEIHRSSIMKKYNGTSGIWKRQMRFRTPQMGERSCSRSPIDSYASPMPKGGKGLASIWIHCQR